MEQMRKWNWREEGLRMGSLVFLRFLQSQDWVVGQSGYGEDGARTDSLQE